VRREQGDSAANRRLSAPSRDRFRDFFAQPVPAVAAGLTASRSANGRVMKFNDILSGFARLWLPRRGR
jgi:hypothetical protein